MKITLSQEEQKYLEEVCSQGIIQANPEVILPTLKSLVNEKFVELLNEAISIDSECRTSIQMDAFNKKTNSLPENMPSELAEGGLTGF
jgi:hypothetical protein